MSEHRERIKKVLRNKRQQYSIGMMILIVEAYRDTLNLKHPLIRSNSFREVTYSKAACDDILRLLKEAFDLPFEVTALDILEQYTEKMKQYASEHDDKEHAECFSQAASIGEYFVEQYWFNVNN